MAHFIWFKFFDIYFYIIGLLLLGIGLSWVMPLGIIAYGIAYRELFGVSVNKEKSL